MVKVIVAERKYDCQELLGKFVDESHYDFLIEEDCDVYMPLPAGMEETHGEDRIILKFRKNFFTKEEQEQAYLGLREAAVESQNRGLAAGPRAEKLGNREWVTEYEFEILDRFIKPTENLFGDDPIEVIRTKYKGKAPVVSNRSRVWLIDQVKKYNFVFEEWIDKTRALSPDAAKEEAQEVLDSMISATTYANAVNSGIAGWFDRYPRIPFGRATSYTRDKFDKFKMSYPFLQSLSRGFKELMPWRYNNQMEAAKKVDPAFLVPGTPFTTITVNKTFRTAAHYDAGDLNTGLSNLLTLSNDGNYTGGYLIAPEYRVAVNVRPGDLLLINNHEVMHGNTPIVCAEGSERISLVVYFREKMMELGSKEYEDCRERYVESRRTNKEHPGHIGRSLWNGISPSMWDNQEWYTYLESKLGKATLVKYHPDSVKATDLEDFFS
jgi:hypothetical protein